MPADYAAFRLSLDHPLLAPERTVPRAHVRFRTTGLAPRFYGERTEVRGGRGAHLMGHAAACRSHSGEVSRMPIAVTPRQSRRGFLALAVVVLVALVIPAGVLAEKPPAPVEIQILNES